MFKYLSYLVVCQNLILLSPTFNTTVFSPTSASVLACLQVFSALGSFSTAGMRPSPGRIVILSQLDSRVMTASVMKAAAHFFHHVGVTTTTTEKSALASSLPCGIVTMLILPLL